MKLVPVSIVLVLAFAVGNAIPPSECNYKFNYNDCGLPPKPVFHYHREGSRCEIAYWKGCRPNLNMFTSEHECVDTCIFGARAVPDDYHKLKDIMYEIDHLESNGDKQREIIATATPGSDSFVATAGVSTDTSSLDPANEMANAAAPGNETANAAAPANETTNSAAPANETTNAAAPATETANAAA